MAGKGVATGGLSHPGSIDLRCTASSYVIASRHISDYVILMEEFSTRNIMQRLV